MTAVILVHILFVFALGACVGSFLNVVVWRLPRGESLVSPPSHCPKCNHKLAWYDNVPIFGWIALGGKCRYCKNPISPRYPIVEAVTALVFVMAYVLLFELGLAPVAAKPTFAVGPTGVPALVVMNPFQHWPMLALYLFTLSCLMAASLIDLELFIIPLEIPYLLAVVALFVHALIDNPTVPGALNVSAGVGALSAGAGIGLAASFVLWWFGVIPTSFPKGEPLLDVDDKEKIAAEIEAAKREGKDVMELPPDYTTGQIRGEILKELAFLLPPILVGVGMWMMYRHVPGFGGWWDSVVQYYWVTGFLGALLGAMVGAVTVWAVRILGTIGFGRVAMGLGDVHLMFGIGAAIGAGPVFVAFFIAPFFGLLFALYSWVTRKQREIPYGPYLSMGSAVAMFCHPVIYKWLGL